MSLVTIEEPRVPAKDGSTFSHHPLFRLGFRPFYLLGAAFAAISIPLWIARYFGLAQGMVHVDLNWHMHEMLFGFAIAIIVGFLFTAGRNWTGLWTPRRGHLAALAALWLAGRIAMLFFPPLAAAAVDLLFLPFAAWPFYKVLKRTSNKRNMFLAGLLGLLATVNLVFHLSVLGWLSVSSIAAVEAAILIVVMIESVIAGRVIPGFTANALPGVKPIVNEKRDRITIALTVTAVLAWVVAVPAPLAAALAFAAGCAQLTRLGGWKSHATVRNPLLWILHVSYAWIAAGFLLLGFAAIGKVSTSTAFHALTVGSMAGLIIGMITRTALGHTGRQLRAGRSEFVMYLLIQLGVIARLAAAADVLGMRSHCLTVAAVCWCAAFVLYVAVYGPYLLRARVDGNDG